MKGGASRKSATVALVAVRGGALGNGDGGVFPDMAAIFNFLSLAKTFFGGEGTKN